jgi:hypothetical protein
VAEINRFGYANVTFEDLLVKVNVIKIAHLWSELCPNGVNPPEIVKVTKLFFIH